MPQKINQEDTPRRQSINYLRVGEEVYRHSPAPILRRITRMDIAGNYYFPAHIHEDENELLLCHEGCYSCKLGGERVDVTAGQALLVQKGVMHADCCDVSCVVTSINFLFEEPEKEVLLLRDNLPSKKYCIDILFKDLEPMLLQLERESEIADGCSSFVQDGLLQCVLWRIIRLVPLDSLDDQWALLIEKEFFTGKLHAYFEAHLQESLAVEKMALDAGMSKRRFEQECKQILGDSPARAFRRYKMERACDLLRNPGRSITQIAAALGFSDPFQFSRTFKKVFGVSPREKR